MRLFDVLGPVMIGPSSSHTAGAARIGYTAQKLLGEIPAQADIGLYGSFATTGKGHGTDKALVAGLLGLRPDDPRLPDSFALAAEQGMAFRIHPVELRSAHPNTAVLTLTGREGRVLSMKAASVGGGRIRVTEIDGVPADFGDFTITRRFRGAVYHIEVKNPGHLEKGVSSLIVDGETIEGNVVPFVEGKKEYHVTAVMG